MKVEVQLTGCSSSFSSAHLLLRIKPIVETSFIVVISSMGVYPRDLNDSMREERSKSSRKYVQAHPPPPFDNDFNRNDQDSVIQNGIVPKRIMVEYDAWPLVYKPCAPPLLACSCVHIMVLDRVYTPIL
jgi:hypothetical protein